MLILAGFRSTRSLFRFQWKSLFFLSRTNSWIMSTESFHFVQKYKKCMWAVCEHIGTRCCTLEKTIYIYILIYILCLYTLYCKTWLSWDYAQIFEILEALFGLICNDIIPPPSAMISSTITEALARLVAVVGSAIALKELFLQLQRHGKRAASNLGERRLELRKWIPWMAVFRVKKQLLKDPCINAEKRICLFYVL